MKTEPKTIKKYSIELTKEQIAIIKAGLQYYWLADDYGYALWGTMPGACFGSSDSYYRFRVNEIYEKLKKSSKVKPDYGWWGDIKKISKLCKADFKIAKKEGEEAEKRMYEDYMVDQMEKLVEASKKTGNYEWEKVIKAFEAEEKQIETKKRGVKK